EADGVPEHIAQEEARHAQMLQGLSTHGREPWHHSDSGTFLRNAVYGFNDGLTANFGLLMGVLGARMHDSKMASSVVLLTVLAGLVADALSMGSSSYLAGKSEQEVYEHEIAMEREEINSMPEGEMEELALIYEAKGLPPAAARQVALQLMADPEIALREKAREELGISPDVGSPLKDGLVTGVATALGAFIPVFPFFFGSGAVAVWTAFAIAMLSHFGVGAARSLFTGRGVFRSGLDMFLVGLGVAVAAYWVGNVLMKHL
ncbi:MAG: VIT1/CCC1 transporter family protein, partial [Candidatus Sumerlaeota bacterium]|nr:VIT1/CCC1 transporter family protein [Candidatus Sumerlaeota bacterium]